MGKHYNQSPIVSQTLGDYNFTINSNKSGNLITELSHKTVKIIFSKAQNNTSFFGEQSRAQSNGRHALQPGESAHQSLVCCEWKQKVTNCVRQAPPSHLSAAIEQQVSALQQQHAVKQRASGLSGTCRCNWKRQKTKMNPQISQLKGGGRKEKAQR